MSGFVHPSCVCVCIPWRNFVCVALLPRKLTKVRLHIIHGAFCIRQKLEKKWEYNEVVHQLFMDLKKACDSDKS